MVLEINEDVYEVKFGMGFIRELDKKYFTQAQSGTKFGMGMEVRIPMLLTKDVVTLAEFLVMGTCTEKKRPTQGQIDRYIDEVEDIELLFDEVVEELKKQNATKLKIKEVEDALEEQKKTKH